MTTHRRHGVILLGVLVWIGKLTIVLSWVPPHPNSTETWESVHDMRRRLNIGFNYTTSRYVDAELCRYLTDEECKENDISMQEHVRAHKKLQKQLRTNPNLGAIQALVLMIRFTDHVDRDLIPKREIDAFWQTKVPEWLDVNSQGRYSMKANVINWVTTDNTEEYYSFGKRGIAREAQQMAWPSLDNLDSRPNWDWSEYDKDGDGNIDSLVIIHSGYGAETFSDDCFGRDYNNRIWAHAFSGSNADTWVSKDGNYKVRGYTIASAFDGDCGEVPGKIGLTTHEYMHTLGLVDLYDGVDPLAASGVGAFDIMADPYGQNGDADNPGHLSAYSKILAEWLEPIEISAAGTFDLKAAEISDEAYRITLADFGLGAEYLLIENRQPLAFDINIWAEGLVIYHVDDAADLQMNLGYPGQDGWPENGNHYQVAVLPKDGEYHLEKGENNGDAGDFWVPGDTLGPGKGGTVHPNTDLYQGGFVQETGIWLSVLSQAGTDMTFQVGGFDGEPPPESTTTTTAPAVAPTAGTSIPTSTPTAAATQETPSPTSAPTKGTPSPTTQAPTAGTESPTSAPTSGTPEPTTPAPTTGTASATSIPTQGTPDPTTQVPTAGTATTTVPPSLNTNSPTQSETSATPAPSIAVTSAATPSPTIVTFPPSAQTPIPTTSVGTLESVPEAWGNYQVTRTPTLRPTPENGFLSSFESMVGGQPTVVPASDQSPGAAGVTGRPYLSQFGSSEALLEGPPKEEDGDEGQQQQEHGFLDGAFGETTMEGEVATDLSTPNGVYTERDHPNELTSGFHSTTCWWNPVHFIFMGYICSCVYMAL